MLLAFIKVAHFPFLPNQNLRERTCGEQISTMYKATIEKITVRIKIRVQQEHMKTKRPQRQLPGGRPKLNSSFKFVKFPGSHLA